MRTLTRLGFALLVLAAAPVACAQEQSEVEYYRQLALQNQIAQAEQQAEPQAEQSAVRYARQVDCETPPTGAFVVIPQYFNSRNSSAKGKVGSTRLKLEKGRANGAGVTVAFNKKVNDVFSFGLMYEYAFMSVRGGMAFPESANVMARERSRWHSHVVGFLPEFNFGQFGKLQLSVIQGFDRANGSESIYPGGNRQRRDINDYGTNVTSLMAWYEKDFELGCGTGWKLTPYAGWRSLYVDVKDGNDWASAPGAKNDDNLWVHLVSGGVKVGYECGPFGLNFRGGVSHRTTHDDVPGYGNRAVAPGVVHFSHKANFDKTVGTVGAGISYAAHKRLVVSVGYDGFFGSDTSAHMGSLVFGIPF